MESTLKLIEDLQALPCLWDVKSQEYKNRDKRREAMESLAKKFSMSNHEMEKKLHNLKSQFRREYKKISASKKSGSSPKKCNWFGYQPLMFLLQGMEPRRSRSTDSDEGEESQTIIEEVTMENKMEGERDQIEEENVNHQDEFRKPPTPKRKKSIDQDYIAKETVDCIKTLTAAVSQRDEFTVYGEHIAYKLRNCGKTPVEISLAQRDIDDIIIKLQTGRYGTDAIWTRQQITTPFGYSPSESRSTNSNYSDYPDSISPSSNRVPTPDADATGHDQTLQMPVSTIEPNRKFEQVDSIPECDIEIKTEQDSGEEMKKEPEQCDEVETKFFINEEVIDIKPEEESRSCLDFSVKESEVKRDKTMWTKDLIKRFIELLKPRECLWRVSSVHYHNKKIRQTALNEIGSELKIHPEEVKQKFNRLRLQFAHEKNRMNSTKSESGSNMYVTRWEFFDSLKDIFEQSNVKTFAKRINTAILPERQEHERTENSHLGELENTTTSTEQSLSMASINRSENNIVNENENDNCIDEDETFPSAEPLASLPNSYSNSSSSPVPVWNSKLDTSSCYEKRNLSDSEELSVINRCLGVLENVQTKDECSIFGQYVASELRLILDEGLRFKLKRAIQMDILRVSNEYANKRFRSTEVVSSVSEEDGAVQEFRVL